MPLLRNIVAVKRVLYDALGHFNNDDGWAMSSHLAITALMALFPFLIFATTLGSFLGAQAFAQTAVHIVFDTWPEQIAEPISREVLRVLTVQRTDLLTYGVVLAAYFASNGIEAVRTSLNRAYRVSETRGFLLRRAQSLIFVLIATVGFLVISVLLVFAPLIARLAEQRFEWIEPYMGTFTLWRFIIASAFITVVTLVTGHGAFKSQVTPNLIAPIKNLRIWAFTFTFLSIGLTTRFRDLAGVGARPFAAFTAGVVVNLVIGFVLSAFIFAGYWSSIAP